MIPLRNAFRPISASTTAKLRRFQTMVPRAATANGDLNNTAAERARRELEVDLAYRKQSFAISQSQDDPEVRKKYRPFLLDEETSSSDWVAQLELSTALKMVESQILQGGQDRLRVLVLHGSMRNRYGSTLVVKDNDVVC
jgi:arsenic resistance protein ArsH